MATARILQFGEDTCHRSSVLEGAGYAVDRCHTITEFRSLLSSPKPPDAVVITEEEGAATLEAIAAETSLPVILFAEAEDTYPDSAFDLVIPVLTSPANWLAKIRETIEHSRVLRDESERLCNQAIQLIGESSDARVKSGMERARARVEYGRNRELLRSDANRLDPTGEC